MSESTTRLRTRPLGPGAPEVTVVGFGGMPLSLSRRPPEADALRALHAAWDAGVTLVDTADAYCLDESDTGHNERLIAKALSSWSGDRDAIVVATKGGLTRPAGAWIRNGRPEYLRKACDRSLRALAVDRIALYQFHAPDPAVPFEESVGVLAELRDAGKIRWAGLSNVSVKQIEAASAIVPVVTVQNRLSPFFPEAIGYGTVDHCARHGIGFLAYSPVGGGRLNQKLPGIAALRPIAEKHGATPHEIVLAWGLAQGETVFVIPGARTFEHALSSVRAASLELDADDLAAIEAAEFSTE